MEFNPALRPANHPPQLSEFSGVQTPDSRTNQVWLDKYLNLDPHRIDNLKIALGDRCKVLAQDLKKEISLGVSTPPIGDFHEKLLETVHTSIKNHQDDQPFLFFDIGGGGGDVAADVAVIIGNYQNNSKNFKGKVLVSEPILPKVANKYIWYFLKVAGIQGIKDLYKVSPAPFPECIEKAAENSDFKKPFDMIHCKNVIHFLPPKVADEFIAHLFKSLKPGGYAFLHANAPYQPIGNTDERVKDLIDSAKKYLGESISSLDYYKYWQGKKDYPGYCSALDFHFYTNSTKQREWLQSGKCLTSYPSDYEKMEQYAHPQHAELGSSPNFRLESIKTIKNYFTVEQLESLAEKHGAKIIESGYIKGEGTIDNPRESKLPRDVDLREHSPLSAYIILQKPV